MAGNATDNRPSASGNSDELTAAVKKTIKPRATEEKTQEVIVPETHVDEPDTELEKVPAAVAEQPGTFVYIGPSVPGGILKGNAIFCGKKDEILEHLATDIGKHPKIKQLIIPVERLAVAQQKLSCGGNAISNTYRELQEAFRKQ